eukprot:231054_1
MAKLLRPALTRLNQSAKVGSLVAQKAVPLTRVQQRAFSGPQEPEDTRSKYDVEPDYWDAWHWEKIVADVEFEIANYDPAYAIIEMVELEHDLKFAKKMLEWRQLEVPKYLTGPQAYEEGVVESAFGYVGYKLRAELDYRVIGGRGGVDTGQNFWDDNFIYGPFGTEENPVLVPSRGRYRYVGCVGGYDGGAEHEIAWFCLKQGPKHRCPLCGQIWQLWTTDSSHKDHPYHDENKDYEAEILHMIHG